MIVVVIIGILAAIAIPIFANQQKSAMEATLKSDMKNAAVVMQTEATKNKGKFTSWLPSYSSQSDKNQVSIDQTKSNTQFFCLVGTNTELSNVTYSYSSAEGKLTSSTAGCVSLSAAGSSGVSFQAGRGSELASSKMLVVYTPNALSSANDAVNAFSNYGYGATDKMTNADFVGTADSVINEYDFIILINYKWASGWEVGAKAQKYYEQGGRLLQDGNDSSSSDIPWLGNIAYKTADGARYEPTYNQGLTPSFPYTFSDTAFDTDSSWRCVLNVKNGGVVIADSVDSGDTCVTMAAITNGSGRWVYMSIYSGIDGPASSAIDWLRS